MGTTMTTLADPRAGGRHWTDLDDFQEFIDRGGMVEPGDDMPEEYRDEVFRFIEFHANSELMGGLTERDWIPHAPGLRLKQVFLAKTQDEIGHAHLLYMVAADMGVKTRDEMLEDLFSGRSRFHNVFHYQAVTWADQVAIAFLVDAAAFASQRAVFAECSYGPYKRILKRIVSEEGFHMRHGEEMLLRLATGTDVQKEMFQAALDRWWWPAVQLFGPDSPPGLADPLLRWKIKSERNENLRAAYVQKYVPLLQGYGFRVPDDDLHQDDDGRWVAGPIDWEPLKATMRQGGPDSARRIATAAANWADTAWVRDALTRHETREAHEVGS
ncbi:MAG: 1,2-phenylacetyl-CoA epoxidase subunit PaaA [Actinomycetota bacterium]